MAKGSGSSRASTSRSPKGLKGGAASSESVAAMTASGSREWAKQKINTDVSYSINSKKEMSSRGVKNELKKLNNIDYLGGTAITGGMKYALESFADAIIGVYYRTSTHIPLKDTLGELKHFRDDYENASKFPMELAAYREKNQAAINKKKDQIAKKTLKLMDAVIEQQMNATRKNKK